MENSFNLKKFLAEGKLLKEDSINNLKQDIQDFWDTLQDDASQSDGEYNAKWDTDFFIEQYPEYEGRENEIDSIVKLIIPSKEKPQKFKGVKGEGSVLDFVKQNLDAIEDSLMKISSSGSDYIKNMFKDIKNNPKLITGDEETVQIYGLNSKGEMYKDFQIAFSRNKITDGGFISKIVVDGKNLFTSY